MTATPAKDLRVWVLLVGAAGLLVSLLVPDASLPEDLTVAGARTLGCAWLMAWWWIGSRLPLAVPALVPLALFPVLGIADSKAAAVPYSNRMVMLLLCGFLLAQAVAKWGLHRRVALTVLLAISVVGFLALPFLATLAIAVWLAGLTGLLEALGDRLPLPAGARGRGPAFVAGCAAFALLGVGWTAGGLPAALSALVVIAAGCMAVGAAVLSGMGRNPYSGA